MNPDTKRRARRHDDPVDQLRYGNRLTLWQTVRRNCLAGLILAAAGVLYIVIWVCNGFRKREVR